MLSIEFMFWYIVFRFVVAFF